MLKKIRCILPCVCWHAVRSSLSIVDVRRQNGFRRLTPSVVAVRTQAYCLYAPCSRRSLSCSRVIFVKRSVRCARLHAAFPSNVLAQVQSLTLQSSPCLFCTRPCRAVCSSIIRDTSARRTSVSFKIFTVFVVLCIDRLVCVSRRR